MSVGVGGDVVSVGVTPLTVSEARAILMTNKWMRSSKSALDAEERRAWQSLVESARDRLKTWCGAKQGSP